MKRQLTLTLLCFLIASCGYVAATAQDLPGAPANIQTIPAGSLVIPMDNVNQAGVAPFNLKAYGLVDKLLQNGVPVMWAIKTGKAKDAVDFTATAKRVYPSTGAAASVNFAGGPFIVHRDFKYLVGTIASTFGNSVNVFELTADATIDIRYVDAFKPKIFIGNKNSGIHSALYDFALVGKQPTGQYVIGATSSDLEITATACYTFVSQPHTNVTDAVTRTKQWVQSGGNYLAECLALATFENDVNGKFQTTTGLTIANVNTTFNYPNADMAFAQFIGTVDPAPGGSEQDWSINAAFANNGHILLQNSGADSNKYAATAAKLYNSGPGGMTFYLGAHNYGAGGTDLTLINGQRMILNGVFVPPTRPSSCNLGFPGTTGYKSVKVTNEATGDGFPSAGDTLTWTITYPNIGSAPITNFQIAEILPAGVTLVGSPTVTLSGTGTTATVNPSYLGTAGSPNLLNAGAVLDVNGKIVIEIQTTINAGFIGTLSNQTTASGTGLPAAGVKSDNVDSTTTGLLGGTTVAASSATQTQNSASVDPTTLQVFAPLSVKLQSASAIRRGNRVKINWESGFESDNLGYNVYRQDQNGLSLVTPSLIAGSALSIAGSRRHDSGFSYSAIDENSNASGSYWIEDLDMDGTRTLHGPIVVFEGKFGSVERSASIDDLNASTPSQPENLEHPEIASKFSSAIEGNSRSRLEIVAPDFSKVKQSYVVANAFAKLTVKKDGIYRLTRAELEAAGLHPNFDLANLRVIADSVEQSISIAENGDVIFFGRGVDSLENDSRIYWLIADSRRGLRSAKKFAPQMESNAEFFMNVVEKKNRMIYASGILNGDDENFYSGVVTPNGSNQEFVVKSLSTAGKTARIFVSLQGLSEVNHIVQVSLNGTILDSVAFNGLERNTLDVSFDASLLQEGTNLVSLRSLGAGIDVSVIETTRLTYPRTFTAENGQLSFGVKSGETVSVNGFQSRSISLFDVTNAKAPIEMLVTSKKSENGFAISIPAEGSDRVFVSYDQTSSLLRPESIASTSRSELLNSKPRADLLIVANSQFIEAVQPLAQLRREQGLRVVVVKAEEVFDLYGFGLPSAQGLRDFLASTGGWVRAPRYVLLVGDSTYDPRNYLGRASETMLPTKLIDTQILETASDDWLVDFNRDERPDLAIGRIPVRTPTELSVVVSKIVRTERNALQEGRKALVISDRGFDEVASNLDASLSAFGTVTRIQRANNDSEMRSQMMNSLNEGAEIVNFVGHGSISILMSGAIFDTSAALQLSNRDRLSLFILQSCLNGYSNDANEDSMSESLLKSPNGGAYAVIASSGVNYPQGQLDLAHSMIGLLSDSRGMRIGDVIMSAKKGDINRDVLRTTQLFGDPSARIR